MAEAELPGGGTSIVPERRVVAFYGAPQADELGILGIGPPQRAARQLRRYARPYEQPDRPVLPAFELISTIVLGSPGRDGKYRRRQPAEVIDRYLQAARDNDFLLMLDIQPGRSTFMEEVQALEPYLEQPDVGLALDPEWNMGPKGIPGQVIGGVGAAEINEVTAYLEELIDEHDLPDKLVVVHQFTPDMVRTKRALEPRPHLDIVLNSDGFGTAADKRVKYQELAPRGPSFERGFKLFLKEDSGLMQPAAVLALKPSPVDLVIYE